MLELRIEKYTREKRDKWDDFVLNQSINGTFLQTRNFLEYHKDRFQDNSLIIYKGLNTMVAVVPACVIWEREKKLFSAHCGSTFGGIVIGRIFYNVEHIETVVNILEEYFTSFGYDKVQLKCTSNIFAKRDTELLSYFLFQKGYCGYDELSSYIDFESYNEDVVSNFTASRRRDYKYSLKNDLVFKRIEKTSEIVDFYKILSDNLRKFDTMPVHTLEELIEFKEKRLVDIVEFYGVYYQEKMIAGSMVFNFGKKVFHTQYLAANQEYLKMYPMNFLDTNLIRVAKERGFRYFSFGISTENYGKILNKNLIQFKEGFGTLYGINKTFVKNMTKEKS